MAQRSRVSIHTMATVAIALMGTVSTARAITFTQDLGLGSLCNPADPACEVAFLEELLCQDPEVYPDCSVDGSYGPSTEAAVIRFRLKIGLITDNMGLVDLELRDYLNALIEDRSPEEFNAPVVLATTPTARAGDLVPQLQARHDRMNRLTIVHARKARKLRVPKALQKRLPRDLRPMVERDTKLHGTLIQMWHDDPVRRYGAAQWILVGPKKKLYRIASDPRLTPGKATLRGFLMDDHFVPDDTDDSVRIRSKPVPPIGPSSRVLVIRLNYPDHPRPNMFRTMLENTMAQVRDFYRENSYGQFDVQSVVVDIPATRPLSVVGCSSFATVIEGMDSADPFVNYTDFDHVIVVRPGDVCNLAAGAFRMEVETDEGKFKGGEAAISDLDYYGTVAHEFGHQLGLSHSHALDCRNVALPSLDPVPQCRHIEYGDFADTMGVNNGHFGAWVKNILGFFLPGQLQTITSPGTYQISPYETSASVKALRLPRNDAQQTSLWIEYRQPIGFDALYIDSRFYDGPLIHADLLGPTYEGGTRYRGQYLIDTTPNVDLVLHDAALAVGKSVHDKGSHWAFTTLAKSASSVSVKVDKVLPFRCAAGRTALQGAAVTFRVETPDPTVTYLWATAAGTPSSGTGTSFTTTFAQPGSFEVQVGPQGASFRETCAIRVLPMPSAVGISSFKVNGTQMVVPEPSYTGAGNLATVQEGSSLDWAWDSIGTSQCEIAGFKGGFPASGSSCTTCPDYLALPWLGVPPGPETYMTRPLNGTITNPQLGDISSAFGIRCRNSHNNSTFVPGYFAIASSPTASSSLGNNAECVLLEATRPALNQGETLVAHVIMKNTGTRAWETDASPHRLAARSPRDLSQWNNNDLVDTNRWSKVREGLRRTVLPGEEAHFTFQLTVQAEPQCGPLGCSHWYPFYWQMVEDFDGQSEYFGSQCRWMIWVPNS